ncbi:MAG: c-type cytochrome [Alphaproteobacteria bacterium]|nr:c-type cytochrome [Alphaproteobacteria bacterium]
MVLLVGFGLADTLWAAEPAPDHEAVARGAYLIRAAGCIACHTDKKGGGAPLTGGRALKTPFGTFYTPNLTPDPETGIGRWSDDDFIRALSEGVSPDGRHYYPAFPYTTYARMNRADMLDLKAYLFAQAPARRPNTPHDLMFPFSRRITNWPWKVLFFAPAPFEPDPAQSPEINRGAYLVNALAHCGECHTPRNLLGAVDNDDFLSGTTSGPEGEVVPNITPDAATGIGDWSTKDLVFLLRTGFLPNGNDVQGGMREAIDDGLKFLSQADLEAIAIYLKSIPPIDHQVRKKRTQSGQGGATAYD